MSSLLDSVMSTDRDVKKKMKKIWHGRLWERNVILATGVVGVIAAEITFPFGGVEEKADPSCLGM